MNAERRTLLLSGAAVIVASLLAQACWATDPCGEGLVLLHEGTCVAALVADAAPEGAPPAEAGGDAGDAASEAAPAEAAAPSDFGKTCAAQSDCSGAAPICAAPTWPYCTQIKCHPGEENAGVCPPGFVCFDPGSGYPSGCLKQ